MSLMWRYIGILRMSTCIRPEKRGRRKEKWENEENDSGRNAGNEKGENGK